MQWLPLSLKVVSLLASLKPCDGVYVFPWRSKSGVYKWLGPLSKRLNMKVTLHQFRHALGVEAIDAETDVLTLMGMGAWASLNSARHYARASKNRIAAADATRAAAAPDPPAVEPPTADDNVVAIERKQA